MSLIDLGALNDGNQQADVAPLHTSISATAAVRYGTAKLDSLVLAAESALKVCKY